MAAWLAALGAVGGAPPPPPAEASGRGGGGVFPVAPI
jgi:hypothetical protein